MIDEKRSSLTAYRKGSGNAVLRAKPPDGSLTCCSFSRASMQAHWRESQVKRCCSLAGGNTSALCGFLAGLHGMVIELELLCNDASSDRGFPPLLFLGPQFLLRCFLHTHMNMCPPKVLITWLLKVRLFTSLLSLESIILHTLCLSISHIKTCFWLCMSVISIGWEGELR